MAKGINSYSYLQFQQGRLIVEQFGEISLAILSPLAIQMIFFAQSCKSLHYDFAQKAITNQIVFDTFNTLRFRSNTITLEQVISASASYISDLGKTGSEDDLSKELQLSGELIGGKYTYSHDFKNFKSKKQFMEALQKKQEAEKQKA